MRALTNGEGEEEEVVASAGAAPGLGRKRRRAEQRGAQRARAAEARGAGRGGRGLRHDPHAQPGRATLRSSAQVAAPAVKAARRSPSPTVKVVSFVDSPVGGAERADDAPSRLDISRNRDRADQSHSAPHSPLPVATGAGSPGPPRAASPARPPRADSPSREVARLTPGPGARSSPSPNRSVALDDSSPGGKGDKGKERKKMKKRKAKGGGKDGKGKGKKSKGKGKPDSTPG